MLIKFRSIIARIIKGNYTITIIIISWAYFELKGATSSKHFIIFYELGRIHSLSVVYQFTSPHFIQYTSAVG